MTSKFFDAAAFMREIEAEMSKSAAAPGGKETVAVHRFVLDAALEAPSRVAAHLSKAIEKAHADLDERLRKVETKRAMAYRGVWSPDDDYSAGDFVTDAGSMWHCYEATRSRPGDTARAWVLAVKKGRDGKDAR